MYGSRIDKRHFTVIELIINQVMPKLLESWPEVKFVIYGRGQYADELKELVHNSSVGSAIEFEVNTHI